MPGRSRSVFSQLKEAGRAVWSLHVSRVLRRPNGFVLAFLLCGAYVGIQGVEYITAEGKSRKFALIGLDGPWGFAVVATVALILVAGQIVLEHARPRWLDELRQVVSGRMTGRSVEDIVARTHIAEPRVQAIMTILNAEMIPVSKWDREKLFAYMDSDAFVDRANRLLGPNPKASVTELAGRFTSQFIGDGDFRSRFFVPEDIVEWIAREGRQ